jgi:hypothetical protein
MALKVYEAHKKILNNTDAVNHAHLSPALCLAASKHSLARNTLD